MKNQRNEDTNASAATASMRYFDTVTIAIPNNWKRASEI